MNKTLSSLKFNIYSKLLTNALDKHLQSFSVCDPQSNVLYGNQSTENKDIIKVINSFCQLAKDDSAVNTKIEKLELPSSDVIFYSNLYNETEEFLGYLFIKVSIDESQDKTHYKTLIFSLVTHIAECIKLEYMLTSELDLMANELSNRYDELNLLYTDNLDFNRNGELSNRLKKLLKNCAVYMDIEMATLIIPDKDISIVHSTSGTSNVIFSALINRLKNIIYTKLIMSKKSVVINNDIDIANIYPDIAGKVLASPIIDKDGSVMGALIIVKNKSKTDFSNSDKNLLEVMSMKASKISQENYDILTGLINRSGFEGKVTKLLQQAIETGSTHCILNIDIDDFQVINDTSSYQEGDKLIHKIANTLKEQVRNTGIVARTGGDEFGILLENCTLEKAVDIAEKIRQSISSKPFLIDYNFFNLTTSIGVVLIDKESESVANLLSAVEVACSSAKDYGKNNVQTFQKENKDIISRKDEMKWVARIQDALKTNKFQLYCQVIEPLQCTSGALHLEILLRLKDEENNILSPYLFIPAAERFYLMPDIDKWVIAETFKTISHYWPSIKSDDAKVAINLSGQTLGTKDFLNYVIEHIKKNSVPAKNICFEVTESSAIANLENAKHFIHELKSQGFQFSLDDFGTGLSSFAYLKSLNVDYLKIDGSFVKEIINDPIAEAMVTAINKVGHIMELETIAEFVENDDIKLRLKTLGVDFAQGYAIAKPVPLEQYLIGLSNLNNKATDSRV